MAESPTCPRALTGPPQRRAKETLGCRALGPATPPSAVPTEPRQMVQVLTQNPQRHHRQSREQRRAARTQQRADEYKRHDRASSHAETMRSKRGVRTGHQRVTPCNTQPGFLTGLSMLLNKIRATDKEKLPASHHSGKSLFFFFTMCETQLFF